MHKSLLIALTTILLPWPSVHAKEGMIVTLQSIPDRIRRQNPHLAAARLRIKEAHGHMRQAGRWDNPSLDTEFENGSGFLEGRVEVGFSQRFPVTHRLQLAKEVSVAELKAAEAEVREVERRLVAEARTGLIEVLSIRQQRALRREQAEVSKALAEFTAAVAEKGELSPIDAGQAKLEYAGFASEILQLDAAEVSAVGALKPLLGMQPSDSLNVSGYLPAATFPAGSVNPENRPDYQVAILEADAAQRGVALERANRYDDLEAGLYVAAERTESVPDDYDTEGIIGLRLKVPLPLWDKNDGNIEAAEARAQREQKEAAALAFSIRHEARTAASEMQEWNKLLREVTGNLLPLAENQATLAEKAYRDGLGDLQAVLRAREQQLQLASSRLDALRNFHLARVRYLAAIGQPQSQK